MFLNKNWSLGGLKAVMKKLTTQVLLFDVLGSGWPRILRRVPSTCVVNFFWSAHSVHQDFTQFFVRKQFKQWLCSIFLIFS